MTDNEQFHALDTTVHITTDFRDRTAVSNIPMANLSVHDLEIFQQDSFNSTKPNTGTIDVDNENNQELVELETASFHSCILTSNDRYNVSTTIDEIEKDHSLPGVIDVSTIADDEPETHPTFTFENDADFNFTVQSVCDLDVADLANWDVAAAFTEYDEISDVKSGQSSDFSTEASSLLFNVWNEDYEGNPDPKMMKKLIAAKHLPEGIDPAAECHIHREKILLQLRTLEDDDSSQGSCHVFLQQHWLGRAICGIDETSECESMVDSIVDTVIVLNDEASDAETIDSLVLEDLNFKKPKTNLSQYALVPDNRYRPGMEMVNKELVLMLPKNATLTRYKEVKNPYLPVQQVVRIEDEEGDYDGRDTGAGYFEKDMEFTLQKYDSTPQRIAELVMKGKVSEATEYDISEEYLATAVPEPIDLSDYIIREKRIPLDDDYIEADRSIACTVEFEDEGDESSSNSSTHQTGSECQDCLWDEEVVLATLMPVGLLSEDDAAILSRGGIVPAVSSESELTFDTIPSISNPTKCTEKGSNHQRDESIFNGESIEPNTKKEKEGFLRNHRLSKHDNVVEAVSTSDTSICSADIYPLDKLNVERKEGYTLPEFSKLEGKHISSATNILASGNHGNSQIVLKSKPGPKLKECNSDTGETSVACICREDPKSSRGENPDEVKEHLNSCSLSPPTDTIWSKSIDKDPTKNYSPVILIEKNSENIISVPQRDIGSSSKKGCAPSTISKLSSQGSSSNNNVEECPESLTVGPTLHAYNISVVTPSVDSSTVHEEGSSNSPVTNSHTSADSDDFKRKYTIDQNQEPVVFHNCEENDLIKSRREQETEGKLHLVKDEGEGEDKENLLAFKNGVDQTLIQWKHIMDAKSLNGTSCNAAPGTVSACDTFLLSVSRAISKKKGKGDIIYASDSLAVSKSKSVIGQRSFKGNELFKKTNLRRNAAIKGERDCKRDEENRKLRNLPPSEVNTNQMQDISQLLDITYESSACVNTLTNVTKSIDVSKMLEITFDESLPNGSREGGNYNSQKINHTEQISSLSVKAKNKASLGGSRTHRVGGGVQMNDLLNKAKESSVITTEQESINNELSSLKLAMMRRRSLSQSKKNGCVTKIKGISFGET